MASPVKINAYKYEELIFRRGRKVKWQEADTCSCSSNGHPDYQCMACKGMGYTLADPVEDLVLLQSITNNQEYNDMAGIFETGDAVLTVGMFLPEVNPETGIARRVGRGTKKNPIYRIGKGDLITLTDDEYKSSEVLVKGTPLFGRPADTLLNEDVVEVIRVKKVDPATGDITIYEKDTDYTYNANSIVWQGVNEPADGENYTVVYTHRPVFTVFTQLPTPRYQDGQDLPRKVALRYRAGGIDRR